MLKRNYHQHKNWERRMEEGHGASATTHKKPSREYIDVLLLGGGHANVQVHPPLFFKVVLKINK
jgi:hypothetical protein